MERHHTFLRWQAIPFASFRRKGMILVFSLVLYPPSRRMRQ